MFGPLDPESAPKYGYLVDGQGGQDDYNSNRNGEVYVYGDIRLILKESVKDRTTVCFGDSFNNGATSAASPIKDVSRTTVKKVSESQASALHNELIEAHVFGNIGLDDIETVIFDTGVPSKDLQSLMRAKGVSWKTDDHWRNNYIDSVEQASLAAIVNSSHDWVSTSNDLHRVIQFDELNEHYRATLEELVANDYV